MDKQNCNNSQDLVIRNSKFVIDVGIVAAVPERLINETDVAHVIGIFATPSAEFIDKLLH